MKYLQILYFRSCLNDPSVFDVVFFNIYLAHTEKGFCNQPHPIRNGGSSPSHIIFVSNPQ